MKAEELPVTLFGKLEYFNPAGSVKDRIANAMIDDAADFWREIDSGVVLTEFFTDGCVPCRRR